MGCFVSVAKSLLGYADAGSEYFTVEKYAFSMSIKSQYVDIGRE